MHVLSILRCICKKGIALLGVCTFGLLFIPPYRLSASSSSLWQSEAVATTVTNATGQL